MLSLYMPLGSMQVGVSDDTSDLIQWVPGLNLS